MSEFLTYANGKGAVSEEKYSAPRLKTKINPAP